MAPYKEFGTSNIGQLKQVCITESERTNVMSHTGMEMHWRCWQQQLTIESTFRSQCDSGGVNWTVELTPTSFKLVDDIWLKEFNVSSNSVRITDGCVQYKYHVYHTTSGNENQSASPAIVEIMEVNYGEYLNMAELLTKLYNSIPTSISNLDFLLVH